MFDQFKAMGAIAGLMRDKEKVRAAIERFRESMERLVVVGSAGGGAVRVTVSGKLRVTDVHFDPALVAGLQTGEGGRAMAQALIAEATNDALAKAQAIIQQEADRQAKDLGLPGMPGLDMLTG